MSMDNMRDRVIEISPSTVYSNRWVVEKQDTDAFGPYSKYLGEYGNKNDAVQFAKSAARARNSSGAYYIVVKDKNGRVIEDHTV